MKNFIKAHPYLSCTGLALATNALVTLEKQPIYIWLGQVISSLMLTTLSSMLITVIDQYVHQNLTGSKTLQYTLTAVESVLAMPPILSAFPSGPNLSFAVFKRCFKDLINPDFSCETSVKKKFFTLITFIQSLGFKYILDLPDKQSQVEIDENTPIDIKYDVKIIQSGMESFV